MGGKELKSVGELSFSSGVQALGILMELIVITAE